MRTYELRSVGFGISFALVMTLIGSVLAVPAILWTLCLIAINDKPRADWVDSLLVVLFVGFGLLFVYAGWSHLFRYPREIRVGDRFIELVWALRRRQIGFGEIVQIERTRKNNEDDTRRDLSIVLRSAEWIALGEGTGWFVYDLLTEHPRIGIYGDWPAES